MNTMIATEREPLLTKADRCEATCPASAAVRVTTEKLGVFHFCSHHFRQHKDFIPGIVSVWDETNPLPEPKEESP